VTQIFHNGIYPIELEIKDATDTDRSASYLDLHIEIDSERRFRTKLYKLNGIDVMNEITKPRII
jgi:hypothetical protein